LLTAFSSSFSSSAGLGLRRLANGFVESLVLGYLFLVLFLVGGCLGFGRWGIRVLCGFGVAVFVEPVANCGAGNRAAGARQHQGWAVFVGRHHFGGRFLGFFVRFWLFRRSLLLTVAVAAVGRFLVLRTGLLAHALVPLVELQFEPTLARDCPLEGGAETFVTAICA
jgi:hypothetical protein